MKLALLAATALVLAPMAQAQDCGPLNTVITSGIEDGFESIMGDHFEDAVYETDISFFELDDCAIDAILGQYYCFTARPTVAEADKVIAPLYDMAKVCLSGGWEWVDLAGNKSATAAAITEGYQMTATRGPNKGAVVRIYMDGDAGEPWRQIWLEVE